LLEVSRAVAKGSDAPPPPQTAAPSKPRAASAAPPAARRDERKQSALARQELANRTRPLRTEVQQIDARLEKLAAERQTLEALLTQGALPGSEIAEVGRRLNHVAAEVAMLEERWLELQGEIEAISAGG
jgi:ATP-binding cassette subfamily F protein 3